MESVSYTLKNMVFQLSAQMKERLDEQEAAIEMQVRYLILPLSPPLSPLFPPPHFYVGHSLWSWQLRLEASCKDFSQKLEQLRSEHQQSMKTLEGLHEEGSRKDTSIGQLQAELQLCHHKCGQLELQVGTVWNVRVQLSVN